MFPQGKLIPHYLGHCHIIMVTLLDAKMVLCVCV